MSATRAETGTFALAERLIRGRRDGAGAAGGPEPLAEGWTPHGWTIQSTPALGTAAEPVDAGLAGVSCPSPVRCVAVGSTTPLNGDGQKPVSLSWRT